MRILSGNQPGIRPGTVLSAGIEKGGSPGPGEPPFAVTLKSLAAFPPTNPHYTDHADADQPDQHAAGLRNFGRGDRRADIYKRVDDVIAAARAPVDTDGAAAVFIQQVGEVEGKFDHRVLVGVRTKLLNNNPVDRKTLSRSSRHTHRSVSTGYNAINVPIQKSNYYQLVRYLCLAKCRKGVKFPDA